MDRKKPKYFLAETMFNDFLVPACLVTYPFTPRYQNNISLLHWYSICHLCKLKLPTQTIALSVCMHFFPYQNKDSFVNEWHSAITSVTLTVKNSALYLYGILLNTQKTNTISPLFATNWLPLGPIWGKVIQQQL